MPNELQPHERRVISEKTELDEKIGKLSAFLDTSKFDVLAKADKALLIDQHMAMIAYSNVLRRRIERFEPNAQLYAAFERAMTDIIDAKDGDGRPVRLYAGPNTADGLRRATIDFGKSMLDDGVVFINMDDKGNLQKSRKTETAAWTNLAKLARATACAVDAGL